MTHKILNGDEALAFGGLSSGIKLVTSYPGSPSSGTVETLIDLAEKHDIYVEWSSNEKVAMEMGIGASYVLDLRIGNSLMFLATTILKSFVCSSWGSFIRCPEKSSQSFC